MMNIRLQSLVEEATEAAVIFATHIGRSEETVSKEAEIEQKQAEVPPEDVLNESSDEEIGGLALSSLNPV